MHQAYAQIPMTYIQLPTPDLQIVTVISQPTIPQPMNTIQPTYNHDRIPADLLKTPDHMQYQSPGIPACNNNKFTTNYTAKTQYLPYNNQNGSWSAWQCITGLLCCQTCDHYQRPDTAPIQNVSSQSPYPVNAIDPYRNRCCGNYSLMTGACANFRRDVPKLIASIIHVIMDFLEMVAMSFWACLEYFFMKRGK
jgi:hypothetical protein